MNWEKAAGFGWHFLKRGEAMRSGVTFLLVTLVLLMEAGYGGEDLKEYSTLENQAFITGTAQANTPVICDVYVMEEEMALLYHSEQQVRASGLYELTVPLPVLGRQCVVVQVGKQTSVYIYHRYRKQLAQDLKGYYLNVYEVLEGRTQ